MESNIIYFLVIFMLVAGTSGIITPIIVGCVRFGTSPVIDDCPTVAPEVNKWRQTYQWISWTSPGAESRTGVTDRDTRQTRGPCNGCRFSAGQSTRVEYTARTVLNTDHCHFDVVVYLVECARVLPNVENGYFQCDPTSSPISGTRCRYGCFEGFQLNGPTWKTCNQTAGLPRGFTLPGDWTPTGDVTCDPVNCGDLNTVRHASKYTCTHGTYFPSRCTHWCDEGFAVRPGTTPVSICYIHGRWEGGTVVCEDIEPPNIEGCPKDQVIRIGAGNDTAIADWILPYVTDNHDTDMPLTEEEGRFPPLEVSEGIHTITHTVIDRAGNQATHCTFDIFVQKLYCPRMIPNHGIKMDCPTGFSFGSKCNFTCQHGWTLEGDNTVECEVDKAVSNFPIWKWKNGPPTCRSQECHLLERPIHGHLSCGVWYAGKFCDVSCDEGYDISLDPATDDRVTTCRRNGTWSRETSTDCIRSEIPEVYTMTTEHAYYSESCCHMQMETLEEEFSRKYQEAIDGGDCGSGSCSLGSVNAVCLGNCNSRRRRDTNRDIIGIRSTLTLLVNEGAQMKYDLAVHALTNLHDQSSSMLQYFDHEDIEGFSGSSYRAPNIICPDGYGASSITHTCLQCQPGTFHDTQTNSCALCPEGEYQPFPGQMKCQSCPSGTFTESVGSADIVSCLDECQPGFFSATGLVPCTPCPLGYYSHSTRLTSCLPCPSATWTDRQAASDISMCKGFEIKAGLLDSHAFLKMSKEIPSFSMFDHAIVMRIVQLSQFDTNETAPFASISLLQNDSLVGEIHLTAYGDSLQVVLDSHGTICGLETDFLESSLEWKSFALSFTDTGVMELVSDPKEPSARAACQWPFTEDVNKVELIFYNTYPDGSRSGVKQITDFNIYKTTNTNQFFYTCGFTVDVHDTVASWQDVAASTEWENIVIKSPSSCNVIDECESSPCMNNGLCTDKINSYICSCAAGFTGDQCEINIDDCPGNTCMRGSTCMDGINTYTCQCDGDSRGEFCEQTIHHGGWSEWTPWESCSVSCGGGKASRKRFCTNPLPDHDGRPCQGEDVQFQDCGESDCPVCQTLVAPDNSELTCVEDGSDINCTLTCNDGYGFSSPNLDVYHCGPDSNYYWNHQYEHNPSSALPKCTEAFLPYGYRLRTYLVYKEIEKCTSDLNNIVTKMITSNVEDLECIKEKTCNLLSVGALQCAPELVEEAKEFYWTVDPDILEYKLDLTPLVPWKEFAIATFTLEARLSKDNSHDNVGVVRVLKESAKAINDSVRLGNFDIRTTTVLHKVVNVTFDAPSDCPEGCASSLFDCVPCAASQFEFQGLCFRCPYGQYQNSQQSTSCISCPEGYTTKEPGSRTQGECTVPCSTGTWSNGTRCRQCKIGMYQDQIAQGICKVCKAGMTNSKRGSKDCDVPCEQGNYGKDGLCHPCLYGTYQDKMGQPQCTDCPWGHITDRTGSNNRSLCKFGAILISIIALTAIILCIILTILLLMVWKKLNEKSKVYPAGEDEKPPIEKEFICSPPPTYDMHQTKPPPYQGLSTCSVIEGKGLADEENSAYISDHEQISVLKPDENQRKQTNAMEEISTLFANRTKQMPHKTQFKLTTHK